MVVRQFLRNRSAVLGLAVIVAFLVVSIFGPLMAPQDPAKQHLDKALTPPGSEFILGSDQLGRDLLSRLLYASRISLIIGTGVVTLGLIAGTLIGLTVGFFGGWVDTLVMRVIDIILSFPGILLALAIASAIGTGIPNVIIAIGIASTPIYCRVVRGSVLRLRNMEFVQAAQAVGATPLRIMVRHLLPNCMGSLVVQTSLRFADAVIVAAGLSFLGLGVPPDVPEWGSLLADGRGYLRSASWIAVFPGFCIMIVVLGFNLMGDGLRDALDPRLRR
jgi:peptide/nickel transport system permease protein